MKFMVCFDGSNAAYAALHIAKKRANQVGAKLCIVTSMNGSKNLSKEDFEDAEELLNKAKRRVADDVTPCEVLLSVKEITTGENLVRIAKEKSMEELYLGIKKRSKVGKLLFGSTVQYLLLNAPCPVITTR
jgi:nucleotide-binding universal stress UspA family protein